MIHPWRDWIPGVLSKQQLQELCTGGYIKHSKAGDKFFDNSSMDLTLGENAFKLPLGAVKPHMSLVRFISDEKRLVEAMKPETDGTWILQSGSTYLFRLEQQLSEKIKSTRLYGQATAKSSVGRLDVLARLMVDGMDRYEGFAASTIGSGQMFLEVTPLTFNVRVKPGISLSQLRFFYGRVESCTIRTEELYDAVLPSEARTRRPSERDGCLTLDLTSTVVGSQNGAAFRAKRDRGLEPVPLWKSRNPPDPKKYWELIEAKRLGSSLRLPIKKGDFYILRSKQKIALTRNVAVYCRATDETIGEMRIHYAGFVHPFFGRERTDGKIGTSLIFEVRGHDVEVVLNDGEKLAKLEFYRMSRDCELKKLKRKRATAARDDYGNQTLQLSNFFAQWS